MERRTLIGVEKIETENQLLAEYARHGSEAAFRELVQRHVNMVHSAALREAGGNAPLAEDKSLGFSLQAASVPPVDADPDLLFEAVTNLVSNAIKFTPPGGLIVLASAGGQSITDVAADLGVSRDTVRKWRGRFQAGRLEALGDEPRPGAPRKITDEQVELVITKTLEERGPGEDTHWSTRSMAAATGMSQSAVSRIWRAFALKPHLVQTWKLSTDPQFIDKVRDVVGLYLDPPDKALVLAVDELGRTGAR